MGAADSVARYSSPDLTGMHAASADPREVHLVDDTRQYRSGAIGIPRVAGWAVPAARVMVLVDDNEARYSAAFVAAAASTPRATAACRAGDSTSS